MTTGALSVLIISLILLFAVSILFSIYFGYLIASRTIRQGISMGQFIKKDLPIPPVQPKAGEEDYLLDEEIPPSDIEIEKKKKEKEENKDWDDV